MTRIAIMQPYFVPYAGYFRLFDEADLFVAYDCVQFPRRGYVHRNRLPDALGRAQWLTLPLQHAPQSAKIYELEFAADAVERLAQARGKFPILKTLPAPWDDLFSSVQGSLVPWLISSLELSRDALGIDCPILCSSTLKVPPDVTGQDRIVEICKLLGATSYVNAPGGRHLYEEDVFKAAGIELSFLPPLEGSHWSILYDLLAANTAVHGH